MEFFADFEDFDDDLFSQSKTRAKPKNKHLNYEPKICTETWFETPTNLEETKYGADYSYMANDYGNASTLYKKCLDNSGFTPLRRDCLEGLALSLMRSGDEDAVTYAEMMHSESSNIDQKLCSAKLLVEIYHWQRRYKDELKSLQFYVSNHPSNADLWFRLAICYARFHGIPLEVNCGGGKNCNSRTASDLCPLVHRFDNKCPCSTCPCKATTSRFGDGENECEKYRFVVCACLVRAKKLFRSWRNNDRSFSTIRREVAANKITELIEQSGVGEDFVKLAKQKMTNKLMDLEQDDSNLCTGDSDTSKEPCDGSTFEDRWFSFILSGGYYRVE